MVIYWNSTCCDQSDKVNEGLSSRLYRVFGVSQYVCMQIGLNTSRAAPFHCCPQDNMTANIPLRGFAHITDSTTGVLLHYKYYMHVYVRVLYNIHEKNNLLRRLSRMNSGDTRDCSRKPLNWVINIYY